MTISLPSPNDSDGNENDKNPIGSGWPSNNFARNLVPRSHSVLHISLPSLRMHDYDIKLPNFAFYGGREPKATILFL